MQQHHVILCATRCALDTLRDKDSIEAFMRKLAYATHSQIVHGPTVVARKGSFPGVTAVAITHSAHLVMHTFVPEREALLEVYSYISVETAEVRDAFLSHFKEDVANMKLVDFTKWRYEDIECEEPNCTRRASRDWHGRKVCQDHYDTYRDGESRARESSFEND